jgi:hypothetical protein
MYCGLSMYNHQQLLNRRMLSNCSGMFFRFFLPNLQPLTNWIQLSNRLRLFNRFKLPNR